MSLSLLQKEIRSFADPEKAKILSRFFKTGKGEYGEGDKFLGIVVPTSRKIAKARKDSPLLDILALLHSEYHEERLIALFLLIEKFNRGGEEKKIADAYITNAKYVNSWDLVDVSAHKILGAYLLPQKRPLVLLEKLAASPLLWKRRIAIISTFAFMRAGRLGESYSIAEKLLSDKEDLMHKAVGWVLREAGKRDRVRLEKFLRKNLAKLPRTTLRYAIERFPENSRRALLLARPERA